MYISSNSIAAKVDEITSGAEENRDSHNQFKTVVGQDPRNASAWKKEKIQQDRERANEQIKAPRTEFEKHVSDAQQHLTAKIYGFASDVDADQIISYRDAVGRVNELDTGDATTALKLFDRALVSRDLFMTKALVERALELGWDDVLDAHAKRYPRQVEDVRLLTDVVRVQEDGIR